MDTVFEPGTPAARPFRLDGNIATGPGVTDMKAGLLAGLYALRAIGDVPFERLTFIANPDEEVGSPTSTPHIRAAAADADVALVLECGRANGDIVSSRKGIADHRIVVHGRAAHAGIEPEKGHHAILEAARIVREAQALNGRWPGVTFNVGTIRGGTRPNVVPDRCELAIEARSVTGDGLDAAIAAIRELAATPEVPGTTIEVSTEFSWRPMEKTDRSARLVEHTKSVAERLGFSVNDAPTGGASDANTTAGHGRAVPRRPRAGGRQRPRPVGVPRGRFDRAADGDARRPAPRDRRRPRRPRMARRGRAARMTPRVGAASRRAGRGRRRRPTVERSSWAIRAGSRARPTPAPTAAHAMPTTSPHRPGRSSTSSRRALTQAGFAFADIVRLRMFITDMSRAGELMAVQAERFRDIRPAATLVEVSALIDPSLLVEIEVDAQR